jgi:hypothetical protein
MTFQVAEGRYLVSLGVFLVAPVVVGRWGIGR